MADLSLKRCRHSTVAGNGRGALADGGGGPARREKERRVLVGIDSAYSTEAISCVVERQVM